VVRQEDGLEVRESRKQFARYLVDYFSHCDGTGLVPTEIKTSLDNMEVIAMIWNDRTYIAALAAQHPNSDPEVPYRAVHGDGTG